VTEMRWRHAWLYGAWKESRACGDVSPHTNTRSIMENEIQRQRERVAGKRNRETGPERGMKKERKGDRWIERKRERQRDAGKKDRQKEEREAEGRER
jgi:hypothetical protein